MMYWPRSFSSVMGQRPSDAGFYIPSQTLNFPLKVMRKCERILTKRVACSDLHFIKVDLEMGMEEGRKAFGGGKSKLVPIRKL